MRVYLDAIGCRLNQSEIEQIGRDLRQHGHRLVGDPAQAELTVINTCTVTASAAADSRKSIRRAARNGSAPIIVTGCWSTLSPKDAHSLPGVSEVVPNARKDQLVAIILEQIGSAFPAEPLPRRPLPGKRGRTRAFIKAQDGCDHHCTYCLTTIARGASRSRPLEAVLADIQWAQEGGVQEAVLTGVQLGAWGQDLQPRRRLADLAGAILQRTDLPRLRFSSIEPWDLSPAFFKLWEDARLCRHLHLPLQSGSARILRRMGRKTTPEAFRALIEQARATIPGLALTTDIMVGFPGESEADFHESLEFVQAIGFAGGHVFIYSERLGTPAARLPERVPIRVRKTRSARMREVIEASARRYRRAFIGEVLSVLWESQSPAENGGFRLLGLADNYLRVEAHAVAPLRNCISEVLIMGEDPLSGRLVGRIQGSGVQA